MEPHLQLEISSFYSKLSMADNDWKRRLGMVYSTNPDFQYATEADASPEAETLPPAEQRLKVSMERAGRKGKTVTLIRGFVGTDEDLKTLAKQLKTKLSTGGSARDGEIVVQGDVRSAVKAVLQTMGYRCVGG